MNGFRNVDVLQMLVALLFVAVAADAQGAPTEFIKRVVLPYPYNGLEPAIDTLTNVYHHNVSLVTALKGLNGALNNATSLGGTRYNITALVMSATSQPFPLNNTIRTSGGSVANHNLYFRHLVAPGNSSYDKDAGAGLKAAVKSSFKDVANLTQVMNAAATSVFGSGWAFLCFTGGSPPLAVVTRANQDNPLMGPLPLAAPLPVPKGSCIPILGLDVWEHAYFLKHGPKRADYLTDFWTVVNWKVVSRNFDLAKQGQGFKIIE